MADAQTLTDVEGVVKWFDARKGFGFIVGPSGQDIFVHFSVIDQPDGFRALRDGERVVYSASDGDKGWSATKASSEVRSWPLGGNSSRPTTRKRVVLSGRSSMGPAMTRRP